MAQIVLTAPAPFSWYSSTYDIYADGTTNFDPEAFRGTGTTYYLSPTGSDSNDGLTPGNAFATLAKAIIQVDVDVIEAAPGKYYEQFHPDQNNTRGYTLQCTGGIAEFYSSAEDDSSNFAIDPTFPNTYKWTGAGQTNSVWDESVTNAYGGWGWLTERASASDVNTLGGWYDSGTDIWVRLDDDRVPDSDVRVNRDNVMFLIDSGATGETVFIDNCRFYGGTVRANGTANNLTFVYLNCHFAYCGSGSGINACLNNDGNSGSTVYLVNSKAYSSYRDGFSYRSSMQGVEINCEAYDTPLSGSNNATTAHSTCSVIRINGEYYDSFGDCVADTGNSSSWLVNAWVHSYGTSFYGDIRTDSNAADEGMWVVNTHTTDSTSDFSTLGGGTIRYQNVNFTEPNESGTTLTADNSFFTIPADWVLDPSTGLLTPPASPILGINSISLAIGIEI